MLKEHEVFTLQERTYLNSFRKPNNIYTGLGGLIIFISSLLMYGTSAAATLAGLFGAFIFVVLAGAMDLRTLRREKDIIMAKENAHIEKYLKARKEKREAQFRGEDKMKGGLNKK